MIVVRTRFAISVAGLLALLVACASASTLYRGKQVREEHVLTLSTDQGKASMSTFDLRISYTTQKQDGKLRVAGEIAMTDHYRITYEKLTRLAVYLLLLDADGLVVDSHRLHLGLISDVEREMPFEAFVSLPEGVAGLSFAYEGMAREGGPDRGGGNSFWLHPR